MHTGRMAVGLALAIAASLGLVGCVQNPPHVIPTSGPSVAPVFKSDAAALAAAKKAYLAYLAVSDQILIDGGNDPDRLLTVATPAELKTEEPGFAEFKRHGWHSTGGTQIDSIELQGYFPRSAVGIVVVYACIDVAKVDVLDSKGKSVVSPTRPTTQPIQATFDLIAIHPNKLALAATKPWSGNGVCK